MRGRRQKAVWICVVSNFNLATFINALALEPVDENETITFAGHPR